MGVGDRAEGRGVCTGVGVVDGLVLPVVRPATTLVRTIRLMMPAITMPVMSFHFGIVDSCIRAYAFFQVAVLGSGLRSPALRAGARCIVAGSLRSVWAVRLDCGEHDAPMAVIMC